MIHVEIGAGPKRQRKMAGDGHRRRDQNTRNYSINQIDQNTEKSPSDLRRLAVAQTPMKDHQQTLARKTRKE